MKKSRGFSKVGIIVGIVVAAFVTLAVFLVIDSNKKTANISQYDFYTVIEGDSNNGQISDHVKTDKDGTYTGTPLYIFEYADYQCPACASMNTKINQVIDELDGKLAVVYRNYLLSYHQNSTAAASAAEAAGIQGYWREYADILFKNQSEWEYLNGSDRTEAFERYFVQASNNAGDMEKFREDVASNAVSKKISFDMGIGKAVEVAGTPAFYVDGQFIAWTDEEGGSVTIDGKLITWNGKLASNEFMDIIKKMVEAKLGE